MLLIGLGAVMVADLFLDWRLGPNLDAFGIAARHSQSTGLAGWGAAAGALLVAFLVLETVDLATGRWTERLVDLEALLAVGVLVATIGAFVGGAVGVSSRGVVELTLNPAGEWPAYIGLALAVLVALVALGRSLIEARVGTSQRNVRSELPISSRRSPVYRLRPGVGGPRRSPRRGVRIRGFPDARIPRLGNHRFSVEHGP